MRYIPCLLTMLLTMFPQVWHHLKVYFLLIVLLSWHFSTSTTVKVTCISHFIHSLHPSIPHFFSFDRLKFVCCGIFRFDLQWKEQDCANYNPTNYLQIHCNDGLIGFGASSMGSHASFGPLYAMNQSWSASEYNICCSRPIPDHISSDDFQIAEPEYSAWIHQPNRIRLWPRLMSWKRTVGKVNSLVRRRKGGKCWLNYHLHHTLSVNICLAIVMLLSLACIMFAFTSGFFRFLLSSYSTISLYVGLMWFGCVYGLK